MSSTVLQMDEAERLAVLNELGIFNSEPEPAFDDITQLAATLCQAQISFVILVGADRIIIKSRFGINDALAEAPRAGSFCDHTIRSTELFEIPNALADERFCQHPQVTGDPELRFYAGVPLITQEGFALGTLCILDRKPRKLIPTQIQQLKILARQVITHLELRKSVRQLEASNKTLEESLAFQKAIFESMSIAVFVIDGNSNFTFCNKGAEKLLGYSAKELIGTSAASYGFITSETLEARRKQIRQKYNLPDDAEVKPFTMEVSREGFLEDTFSVMRSDGTVVPVEASLTGIIKSDGNPLGFLGVAKDISLRKKTEEQLKQSLAEISDLYNNAPCGYASLNKDGIFIRGNDTFLNWLGYTREEFIGKIKAADLFRKEDVVNFYKRFARLKRQGFMNDEIELIRQDGTVLPLLLSAVVEYDQHGNFRHTRSVLIDITERRTTEKLRDELYAAIEKANAQLEEVVQKRTTELRETIGSLVVQIQERDRAEKLLRQLSHRLVSVQEEERGHIARELHDEIGQYLTALKLQLEMIWHTVPEAHSGQFIEAQKLINELIVKTRQISLNLRPTLLDDLGLLPALEAYVRRYQTNTGIKINLVHTGIQDQRFSPQLELTVFRIIQEALTNIARYAKVTMADVRLWVDKDYLNIEVQDEGDGFDYQAALSMGNSGGLLGMRERANLMGGRLTVQSDPIDGTLISAILPLAE